MAATRPAEYDVEVTGERVVALGEKPAIAVADAGAVMAVDGEEEEVLDEEHAEGEEEEVDGDDDDGDYDDVDNFTTSEIVTVHVGPKRKRFFLHRELICERSPFMEKCLQKGRFDEGYKNELYLPEDDPKAFAVIVDWIYRNRLPLRTDPSYDLVGMSAAYCMADKFGMEELQNSIMDSIRGSFSRRETEPCKTPNFTALALTHMTGPHKSPLKRFYVEHLVHHMMKHPKWYHDLKRNENARVEIEELFKIPDLVFYIMKKVWQFTAEAWKDPALWDRCCYHVHATTACARAAAAAAVVSTTAKPSSASTSSPGQGQGSSRHYHALTHGQASGLNPPLPNNVRLRHHGPWPSTISVWNNSSVRW
ncbi:hypothetical protein A1O3_05846 [Capronia epimyces CBS 606.96]|uniref:BTB domain-containing protein n=1 Tax=Capronia epimyces CBS 606.96 TaxID=1182542 RepID=W9Y7E5_9EURO|nr:uncharacterized protein A1O3_05846 [Capronia epimyces CBS 606.96]EXJ85171.1 hypothetical protein A1O3_05846 [Capronia epimyces CBS 606.96]